LDNAEGGCDSDPVGRRDAALGAARISIEPVDQSREPLSAAQLALYIERGVKPRRIDPVTRIALTLLSRFFGGTH